jgi:hypothetical protein
MAAAAAGLIGLGRKGLSRLGFTRGLHGENAGTTGNASGVQVGETGAREGRMAWSSYTGIWVCCT